MYEICDGLWISDIQAVQEESTGHFDRVVTVCQDDVSDNVGCRYNHFSMADGPACGYGGDCSYELFHEAALTVLGSIAYGETVLVHCHMGQSRSVSVSIAALAAYHGWDYRSTYDMVEKYHPQIYPDSLLVEHAKKFIDESR